MVWCCERRLGLQRENDRRERALLCCLAENWREEGDLQCGCPHSVNDLILESISNNDLILDSIGDDLIQARIGTNALILDSIFSNDLILDIICINDLILDSIVTNDLILDSVGIARSEHHGTR